MTSLAERLTTHPSYRQPWYSRSSRKRWAIVPVLLCGLLLLGVRVSAIASNGCNQAASGFVGCSGTQLMLNGSPLRLVGWNDYRLEAGSTNSCGGSQNDDAVAAEMAQHSHANAARFWAYQSYGFSDTDRALSALAAHGIFGIPVLTNQWGACEKQHNYHALPWYQGAYNQPGTDGYALSFKQYAVAFAQHYANDTRIGYLQLVNEAEARDSEGGSCNESAAASALRSFEDDVIPAMRAVDPNHLIDLGTMGGGQCGIAGSDYTTVHAGATSLCEFHDYNRETEAMPQHLADDLSACNSGGLNKPLVIDESGIKGCTGSCRAQEFDAKMNAAFTDGVAGYEIWSKSCTGCSFGIPNGDPTEAVVATYAQSGTGPPSPTANPSQTPTPSPPTATPTTASPTPSSGFSGVIHCDFVFNQGKLTASSCH